MIVMVVTKNNKTSFMVIVKSLYDTGRLLNGINFL